MKKDGPVKIRRMFFLKLLIIGGLLFAVSLMFFKRVDVLHLLRGGLAWIRTIGPVPFFVAMAILPAFGFPLLAFSLTAGPVFGPKLGLPLVSVLVVTSIVANLAVTYWLSRYAFRPVLGKLIIRFGYALPEVLPDDYTNLAVLVRVTPGPPFFVQSYLLGLAGVPLGTYMLVSSLIAGPYAVAVVFFGDSLADGKGKLAFLAFSGLVALAVLVQWIRRKYQRKKTVISV